MKTFMIVSSSMLDAVSAIERWVNNNSSTPTKIVSVVTVPDDYTNNLITTITYIENVS